MFTSILGVLDLDILQVDTVEQLLLLFLFYFFLQIINWVNSKLSKLLLCDSL